MRTKKWMTSVAFTLVCCLVFSACATTGESAGLGAILGAGAGAIIGAQSGNAAEGAAIGAVLGAGVGVAAFAIKKKQIAKRQEVLDEYKAAGTPIPTEPTVLVDNLKINPGSVAPGQEVEIVTECTALNIPPGQKVNGNIKILKDGVPLHEGVLDPINPIEMNKKDEGRAEFSTNVTFPENMAAGEYTVQVEVQNGQSTAMKESPIVLAAA